MKKTHYIKIFAVILSVILLTTTMNFGSVNAYAETYNNSLSWEERVERRSASGVAIFVLGILVGYVVDGVLIYSTGYSAGQLTSQVISKIVRAANRAPQGSKLHFNSNGDLVGGSSGKYSVLYIQ